MFRAAKSYSYFSATMTGKYQHKRGIVRPTVGIGLLELNTLHIFVLEVNAQQQKVDVICLTTRTQLWVPGRYQDLVGGSERT